MLRPLTLLLCSITLLSFTSYSQAQTWELGCSLETPKLLSIYQHLVPTDKTSPKIGEWTYVYAMMELKNSSEGTLPVAVSAGVQPMRDDAVAGRWMPAMIANDKILAAVRAAEGDEELSDLFSILAAFCKT